MNKQKGDKFSTFSKEKLIRCVEVAVNLESAIHGFAQEQKDMSIYQKKYGELHYLLSNKFMIYREKLLLPKSDKKSAE
jgi:hypothetical protein